MMRSPDSFVIILAIASITALDTITAVHIVNDGDTIVSSGGKFELGFFSPGSSKNRHLGIWYKSIPVKTVVWVANRYMPIKTTFGALELTSSGILNVFDNSNGLIMWSSNILKSVGNPVAQLLDNGNFVVREKDDDNPEHFLWQSFYYPTDTLLPGTYFGKNFLTGQESYLSSWKSSDDPAPGGFTYRVDPTGYPHLVLRNGPVVMYRTGPWNGLAFNGRPKFKQTTIYTGKLIFNDEEVYYIFELTSPVLSRFVLNGSGEGQRWIWVNRTQNWGLLMKLPIDNCDNYTWCGPYSSCNIANIPLCGCLDKFQPKDRDNWAKADWSDGCVRRKPLNCQKGDGFYKYSGLRVPDIGSSWFNENMTLKECATTCLKNCSCTAYANLKITAGGSGCLQWYGDLIDIRDLSAGGQDIYVRVAYSESDRSKWRNGDKLRIILTVLVGMILVGLSMVFYLWKEKKTAMRKRSEGNFERNSIQDGDIEGEKEDLELPIFCLRTVSSATNYFAFSNKLGQGGFGPVFKGVLQDGQEIAVKCLSETSKQGIIEFMNEVKCIAKLQHRNLVRLLGYCIQGMDKILIYEYMPNKSLDWHIFDETRSNLLDWPQRFHIIDGIARGLLYLHQDSRLRIIHRDLKAGNILLDKDMNPKISDFGLAKTIKENETASSTNRVVGTYGYMSPEYAVDGLFSTKSDVFSLGVLVLEIVSGSRNRGFMNSDHGHNLLGHAWRLHKENRSNELMQKHTTMDSHMPKVLRLIHIGLLCVQQFPEDRPNMSSVVLMLGSEGELPVPKKPGFFTERNITGSEYLSTGYPDQSCDAAATSTQLQGR